MINPTKDEDRGPQTLAEFCGMACFPKQSTQGFAGGRRLLDEGSYQGFSPYQGVTTVDVINEFVHVTSTTMFVKNTTLVRQ